MYSELCRQPFAALDVICDRTFGDNKEYMEAIMHFKLAPKELVKQYSTFSRLWTGSPDCRAWVN